MFTLGNKEAIVNSTAQCVIPQTDATSDDLLTIQGFGTFHTNKITGAEAQRAKAESLDKMVITVISAASLGITSGTGVAVVFHLRLNTLRQASETAIDFIKRGRPMILEISVDTGDTNAVVATKLKSAFDEYVLKFANANFPITMTRSNEFLTVEVKVGQGYIQINEAVSMLKRGDIFATTLVTNKFFNATTVNDGAIAGNEGQAPANPITLLNGGLVKVDQTFYFAASPTIQRRITDIVGNDIYFLPSLTGAGECVNTQVVWVKAAGLEPVNDGKYLEENVRMSTPFTSDTYAINPQTVPIIGANYTMVSWTSTELTAAEGSWATHKVGDIKAQEFAENRFTLYLNEAVCRTTWPGPGTAGTLYPVSFLLTWLLQAATYVSLADFLKANGATSASVADFIA